MGSGALEQFHPAVREWFRTSFATPTPAQAQAWPPIKNGDSTLLMAPTGIEPVRPAAGDPDPAYRVNGYYAVVSAARGSTLVRWTENGVTYEVSSRSLDAATLVELANKLR